MWIGILTCCRCWRHFSAALHCLGVRRSQPPPRPDTQQRSRRQAFRIRLSGASRFRRVNSADA